MAQWTISVAPTSANYRQTEHIFDACASLISVTASLNAIFLPCHLCSVIGHEAMAAAVRQSAYFRCLPELPVSCRQFDGDASNIPIIFEDIYVPLTDVSDYHSSSVWIGGHCSQSCTQQVHWFQLFVCV